MALNNCSGYALDDLDQEDDGDEIEFDLAPPSPLTCQQGDGDDNGC